jgi:hypothetical protein
MSAYELISPITNKPCGVWVCGECNLVTSKDVVDRCCKPCDCGKPSRNRFECKCGDCVNADYAKRMAKKLDDAELVDWDGESMIFTEDVSGSQDGWFGSPDDLADYIADEEEIDKPEFAFLGRKVTRELDIAGAIEQMTDDTYEDAELHIGDDDWKALLAAVDAFNAKYKVTYYEHDYKKKVRIP